MTYQDTYATGRRTGTSSPYGGRTAASVPPPPPALPRRGPGGRRALSALFWLGLVAAVLPWWLDTPAGSLTDTADTLTAYATGRLDPSGYVKGWSVQVASDRLLAGGAANHCLNAGGDVRVRGHSAAGQPWRIGVRHPWDPTATCLVLTGTDLAVATSGVYERGHHVLDPRSGTPARGLRSVTVVGPDLGVADAYATAAVAMGPSAIPWLDALPDHPHAVVTDEARLLHSTNLPLTP